MTAPLCVVFIDHPEHPEWTVQFLKGGCPEDHLPVSEWRAAGLLMTWFFQPGRESLRPNTPRKEFEFEFFNGAWFYGTKPILSITAPANQMPGQ